MTIIKRNIKGEKGRTIFYRIPNIRAEGAYLKWDAFRFYSPLGVITDTEGDTCFDVEANEILISRDDTLNIELKILVTKDGGVEVFEVLEGAEHSIQLGLEGDVIINGFIPVGTGEIIIEYKEVTVT